MIFIQCLGKVKPDKSERQNFKSKFEQVLGVIKSTTYLLPPLKFTAEKFKGCVCVRKNLILGRVNIQSKSAPPEIDY